MSNSDNIKLLVANPGSQPPISLDALRQGYQQHPPFAVIWLGGSEFPAQFGTQLEPKPTRCLIVLVNLPVDIECLQAWREWGRGICLKMLCVKAAEANEMVALIQKACTPWLQPLATPEAKAFGKGDLVKMPGQAGKHDPALLTMMFGSMGELLTRMDTIQTRFTGACSELKRTAVGEYQKKIKALLKQPSGSVAPAALSVPIEPLPRVLLLGETGVGKTLFARYLQGGSGSGRTFRRIAIPEYLGKEDMLEYDLFGYAHGAYTGGNPDGDLGQLLGAIGGVIFLDEIGTASPAIQAKLLAYMDDYCVRPRGWSGEPFKCQTLIVAATNLSREELEDSNVFRPDLLARFTDVVKVPSLRNRKDDLPFVLDCLLQNESFNPKGRVSEIGEQAVLHLQAHEFKANFRELETMVRQACARATDEDRHYLVTADFASGS